MGEILPSIVVTWLGAIVFMLAVRRRSKSERPLLWLGFLLHIVCAIGQVAITKYYYGGGDMLNYFIRGLRLAELVNRDFFEYFPAVLAIAAKQVPTLPIPMFGMGSSTGAMNGYVGLAAILTGGSLYASCMLFSFGGLFGQFMIYDTVRELFPTEYRRRAIAATFLIPSVAFWSSGMLKESIALLGLGIAFRGLFRVFVMRRQRGLWSVAAAFGLFIIYTTKAYILLPLLLAMGAWVYLNRVDAEKVFFSLLKRPWYAVIVAVAVVVGVQAFAQAFPEYSPADFDEETARLQGLYYAQYTEGSSTYRFESDGPTADRQLYLAPFGFFSAMFRPLPFEIHNAMSLLEASMMFVLTLLFLKLLFQSSRRRILRTLLRNPVLVFFLIFVVVFGTGVGLATPNLGSLARYRIPMLPFYALLLAALIPLKPRRS